MAYDKKKKPNLYALICVSNKLQHYGYNNPIKFNDPSGHCPPSVCQINGFPSDPYYATTRIQRIHQRALYLQGESLSALERFASFMDYAGSLYGNDETEQFMIDVTTVMFGQNYDPSSGIPFHDFRDYAWSPYYIGHGGFDPNYGDGVDCETPEACDTGWNVDYTDDSGGQARHFWFFAAIAYFDSGAASWYGSALHDGTGTWLGNILQTNPTTREWVEYPTRRNGGNGIPFSPADEPGVSAADFYVGWQGVNLGGKLRLNTLNQCVPGACIYFRGSMNPSQVGNWIRTNLGQ